MEESRTYYRKVASSSLGPAEIGGGGMNVQRSIHLQYHDEVPLSKATNPQLLPRCRSINGCPLLQVCLRGVWMFVFTAVCVHCTWMGKCRARIPSIVAILGCMSCHFVAILTVDS